MVPPLFSHMGGGHPLKLYRDAESGFSLLYPDLPGWTIHTEIPAPGRVAFVNEVAKATLVFGFIQLPTVISDLSDPRIFQLALDDIVGSYQKSHPHFMLFSSSLVMNPNNSVKGVQMVYTDQVSGRLCKGRHITFLTGSKRYDVTALAGQESFDAMDNQFFIPVTNSFTF